MPLKGKFLPEGQAEALRERFNPTPSQLGFPHGAWYDVGSTRPTISVYFLLLLIPRGE